MIRIEVFDWIGLSQIDFRHVGIERDSKRLITNPLNPRLQSGWIQTQLPIQTKSFGLIRKWILEWLRMVLIRSHLISNPNYWILENFYLVTLLTTHNPLKDEILHVYKKLSIYKFFKIDISFREPILFLIWYKDFQFYWNL